MIPRAYTTDMLEKLQHSNKIILLYGPRQVGKTTLVRRILDDFSGKCIEVNADQSKYIDVLSSRDLLKMRGLMDGYDLLSLSTISIRLTGATMWAGCGSIF